jgi:hypothetical protein
MMKNLQHDFDNINDYLQRNELYISIEKTCFMPIMTSHMNIGNIDIILHANGCPKKTVCQSQCIAIKSVNYGRYLGVEIDKNWKFYNHVENLIVRLRQTIPVLYNVRDILNCKNKKLVYESCIMSITRYACSIYGTTSNGLIERLQKLHNKAVKVLFKNDRTKKQTTEIFREHQILTIKQLVDYTIIAQNYFETNFKLPVERKVRNNNNWLVEPKWRNSYGKRGLSYLIPHLFNKLPAELRNLNTKQSVKREIKSWIIR